MRIVRDRGSGHVEPFSAARPQWLLQRRVTVGLLSYAGRWLRSQATSRVIVVRFKEGEVDLHAILELAGRAGAHPVVDDLRKIERPGEKPRVEATLTYAKPLDGHEGVLTRLSAVPGVIAVTRGGREEE